MYVLDFTAFIYDHVCFRNVTHNEIYNRVKFAFKELSKAFCDKWYIHVGKTSNKNNVDACS